MIDTHCHLDMPPFENDREESITRAHKSGIEFIISVGSDLQASLAAVNIAKAYGSVYAAVGIHPHDARLADSASIDSLKTLIRDRQANKIVALGEIGLDYHYDHSPRSIQREAFKMLLSIAVEHDIAVIIHNREADEDTRSIIESLGVKKALFHCFSSEKAMAEWVIGKGYYLSFAGNITFKKAQDLREIAAWVPDNHLMIETDAPYLAPEPCRGKRNEPAYLEYTAKRLAEIRDLSFEDIDRITSLNAKRFFGIGSLPASEIVYKIRDNIYINLTSRCSNSCAFCVKFDTDFVKGHNLRLKDEPSEEEIISAIGDPRNYREVVFCGFGEPTIRLQTMKKTAQWIKARGGRVRLNTNGLGNLINQRDILPELAGIIDSVSVSLNAHNSESYNILCKPTFKNAYEEVLRFIKRSVDTIKDVTLTVVETEGVDIAKCRDIAKRYGASFRVRKLDSVG